MTPVRTAVVGVGQFGQNHARVLKQEPGAELAAVVDIDAGRARNVASAHQCEPLTAVRDLYGKVQAAVVAVPTSAHADIGCALLENGIDVLVEKPIAADLTGADRLIAAAAANQRILQVGHLERFNPAITALMPKLTLPLFFEIHRMSVFSPRSLDVDVVLDLMIHDLDLVLQMAGRELQEIRAAGVSILSEKVDIANVRLLFEGGCVANLTASRVSTEKVRKLRLFQPHQYISLDYSRQDAAIFTVDERRQIGFEQVAVTKGEPLQLQCSAFLTSVVTRAEPQASGQSARRTLEAALSILDKIREHSQVVDQTLVTGWKR